MLGRHPAAGDLVPAVVGFDIDGPSGRRTRWGEFLYNMGGTIVGPQGRQRPLRPGGRPAQPPHPRPSGLALNAGRSDLRPEALVAGSWGDRPHQQGDRRYLIGTGPAATEVMPLSSDGLGNKIIGTGFNCSGALTLWGTVLSREENFQGGAGAFFLGCRRTWTRSTQTGYVRRQPGEVRTPSAPDIAYTTGTFFGLVGEKYGWVVEIDPADPGSRARSTPRSAGSATRTSPSAPRTAATSSLTWVTTAAAATCGSTSATGRCMTQEPLHLAAAGAGTLYVARPNPDGTGEWILLVPDTPCRPDRPVGAGVRRGGSPRCPGGDHHRRQDPAAQAQRRGRPDQRRRLLDVIIATEADAWSRTDQGRARSPRLHSATTTRARGDPGRRLCREPRGRHFRRPGPRTWR